MTLLFAIIAVACIGLLIAVMFFNKKLEGQVAAANQESERLKQYCESETQRVYREAQTTVGEAQKHYESETQRVYGEAQVAVADAQKQIDQQFTELKQESERLRQHYETETRKSQDAADALVAKTIQEFEPLRKFEKFRDAETEVQRQLADALKEATSLRAEAQSLMEQAKNASADERSAAHEKAKDIHDQADARLNQALHDAGRIMAEAEKRAEQIGGDAYRALRDKEMLEQAAEAMRNVIEGYGDRYLVPTHSLLDNLAADFGRTAVGQAFAAARAQSKRMVEQGEAATCDYAEANRRNTAIQFVIHAFNGGVDAILTRIKADNYGMLEQKIRDAFSIVNKDGSAFRNARILPAYRDARLAELKWGAAVQELNRQWQDEQRSRRDELRAAQRDAEEIMRAQREAARDTELKKQAVAEAEKQFANASAEMKAQYEQKLEEARQKFIEATTRELTAAQLGKVGCIYIISNIGSFNYEGANPTIFKIGMTRRPIRQERIDELSNASVPFAFDIHALIKSENAPKLETKLHHIFRDNQVNKNNFRKEFFRVTLAEIRQAIEKMKQQGEIFVMEGDWIEKASAEDFYRSRTIENNPQELEKWHKEQEKRAVRLEREALRPSVVNDDADSQET
ncbi:MAG TPA: DUF4041 domain-containing protein [Candidatus Limnocylindrales bacterium]|nr:DUF4041 domain-containing protein [Candidatus Limnocylindrales bacterium]